MKSATASSATNANELPERYKDPVRGASLLTTLSRHQAIAYMANSAPHRPRGRVHDDYMDEANYLEAVIAESTALCMGDVLAKLTLMAPGDIDRGAVWESYQATALSTALDYLWTMVTLPHKEIGDSPVALWAQLSSRQAELDEDAKLSPPDDRFLQKWHRITTAMEERLAEADCCHLPDVLAKLEYLSRRHTVGTTNVDADTKDEWARAAAKTALDFMRHFASLTHMPGTGYREPTEYAPPVSEPD